MMTQQQIDAIFRRTDAVPENIKASSGYVGARHEWFISVSGEDGFLMPSREIAEITASAKTNTLALIAHIKDQDVLLAALRADLDAARAENEQLRVFLDYLAIFEFQDNGASEKYYAIRAALEGKP